MNARIVEVGPRDGLQNEAVRIPTEVKIAFVDAHLRARSAPAGWETLRDDAARGAAIDCRLIPGTRPARGGSVRTHGDPDRHASVRSP